MLGQMMNMPLMISNLIVHADNFHGDAEIVSRLPEGGIHRYTYRDAHHRSRQLAQALTKLGVEQGDRIGTLAWNTHRHFEIYYGVSGMGAICHTINPRLFPEQLAYIINHAEDDYVFFDLSFVALVESLVPQCPKVKAWIALGTKAHLPDECKIPALLAYENLIAEHSAEYEWPQFDENTASSLCYTSGTTGNPKGVLYSHRSTVLHAYAIAMPDSLNLSARDSVLPVVPMFHVNAWGLPYAVPLTGAKFVLPGAMLDGASLRELFEQEQVTIAAGVPTVWLGLLQYLQTNQLKLSTVKTLVIGGAAAPAAIIRAYDELGVNVLHAWGMTELSPVGTANTFKRKHLALPPAEKEKIRVKQGRPPFGVQMKVVDGEGKTLPNDGKTFGDLLVRGPWVVDSYFKSEQSPLVDGWFPTGDVATLDPDGYMQITDRSKDVIKSGGEWISSIEIENLAVGHPAVMEAAVIGVAHPKWDERPLLVVVKKKGMDATREELLAFMRPKLAKWWLPDDVVFVDSLPHTATGKLMKTKLREQFRSYKLGDA